MSNSSAGIFRPGHAMTGNVEHVGTKLVPGKGYVTMWALGKDFPANAWFCACGHQGFVHQPSGHRECSKWYCSCQTFTPTHVRIPEEAQVVHAQRTDNEDDR